MSGADTSSLREPHALPPRPRSWRAVRRVSPASFRDLPLEAHTILEHVPLHDVTVVDLPGGGPGRVIADLRELMPGWPLATGGRATRALFALRGWLGRAFGWDEPAQRPANESYLSRVPAQLARRSLLRPGVPTGLFTVLYELEDEALMEARNAIVHAFLCTALRPTPDGYQLYLAVYVQPLVRWTGAYMAAIEPFRRLIVYPSMLRTVQRVWRERYAPSLSAASS